MKRYIFGIIIAGADNNFRSTVIAGDKELKGLSMSKVLDMGWIPVRETPLAGNGASCYLVVLEREEDSNSRTTLTAPERKPTAAVAPVSTAAPTEVKTKPAPLPPPTPAKSKKPEPEPEVEAADSKPTSDSDISFDFLND